LISLRACAIAPPPARFPVTRDEKEAAPPLKPVVLMFEMLSEITPMAVPFDVKPDTPEKSEP
jgi:hypothetical protein